MKYDSNTLMYLKDIVQRPFFIRRSRAVTLIIGGIYLKSNLTCILCMNNELNTPMYFKDTAQNPFFVCTDKGDAICSRLTECINKGGGQTRY